jgi:hypothetical protein
MQVTKEARAMAERDRELGVAAPRAGETASETAKSAVREVSSAAREVARERAQGLFETNKAAACAGIHAFANALRAASYDMDQGGLAQAAWRAAEKVEDFSRSLESRDVDAMIDAAQDYARRQPALFLGGAFAAGFALARFLKASSARRRGFGRFVPSSDDRGESFQEVARGGYAPPRTP